jgi:hypothetical protein
MGASGREDADMPCNHRRWRAEPSVRQTMEYDTIMIRYDMT